MSDNLEIARINAAMIVVQSITPTGGLVFRDSLRAAAEEYLLRQFAEPELVEAKETEYREFVADENNNPRPRCRMSKPIDNKVAHNLRCCLQSGHDGQCDFGGGKR